MSPTAFLIVYELVGSRLSDVDKRAAAQMLNAVILVIAGHPPTPSAATISRSSASISACKGDGSSALAPRTVRFGSS